ncbi:NACHT and WD40 domain protein [Ophiocordyceps sinensis CO18]|uniref:NACHT and WD40 domain protein n=1 Tax=Ophiocordyceps sinensis (strain Co18 / CGMCC 3.14243) TaxID=911162 RepID=T5AJE2_OPHSC|nr:NACHT and WD40 domain protein [Ophiocordyceps sinensis CO18]
MTGWIGVAVAMALVLTTVASGSVITRLRRRRLSPRPEGIQIISDPPDAKFEIVAAHGLGAHPEHTWMCSTWPSTDEPPALPREKTHLLRHLIKDDFPDARIVSFAHNSDWLIDGPVKTAQQIGHRLLDELAEHRSRRPRVPIVFIGHSFGGIIIKEALCKPGDATREVADSTCGIIFLGTPHLGSPVSRAGSLAAYLTGFLGSDTSLLLALASHRNQLSDLEDRFIACMNHKRRRRDKTRIASFYETKPTYLGCLSLGVIVSRDSARGPAEVAIPIDTDHSGLNKCRERNDQLYQRLLDQLRRLRPTTTPTLNANQLFIVDKLVSVKGAAFDSRANEHEALCLQGTRRELLDEINEWASDPAREAIYWLQGKAGTGKSTIARTVALASTGRRRLGASFFFKRAEGDRGNARHLFTTMAAQLARQLPALAEHMRNAMESHPDIADKALVDQFEKLILKPLEAIPRAPLELMTVVIDALDECDGDQDVKAIIYQLSRVRHSKGHGLKFFVTSRFEPPIRLGFESIHGEYVELPLHEIPEPMVERDIAAFLNFRLKNIQRQSRMSSGWPSQSQLHNLTKMAIPLFIFAATACLFIEDDRQGCGTPDDRLKQILEYQAYGDLDPTYLPVLTQMMSGLKGPRRKKALQEFKEIVGSIAALANPLPAAALAHLLDNGITAAVVNNRLLRLHSVLDVSGDAGAPVRLFHESFRDFLIHPDQRDQHEFWVDEISTHEMLADRCLQLLSKSGHLKKDICNLQMHGTLREHVDRRTIDSRLPPEVQYACLYWVHHLKGSRTRLHDEHQALQFLQRHFLHWVEALSLMGRITESVMLVGELQSLTDLDKGAQVLLFLDDAKRFILHCRSGVDQAPLQVYSSALLFAPERSVIRETFQRHISWITTKPVVELNWSLCLLTLDGHRDGVESLAFSGDGRLASGSADQTVNIWDAATGALQRTLEGHDDYVESVAFSDDSQLLASAGGKTVKVWDVATGALQRTLEGHGDKVNSVAFFNDGRLASGSDDKTVKVWDVATGLLLWTLEGHESVGSVAFSQDGWLASGSRDKAVKIWDAVTGALQRTLEGHISPVAFSTDGRLASGSRNGAIKVWDVVMGALQWTLRGHSNYVLSVAFSSNDRLLASGSADYSIKIWNAATGTLQQTLEGHGNWVWSVAFSSNGRLLASVSNDGTIKVWDATKGALQQKLGRSHGRIPVVEFSRDGRLVASASDAVRIWDAETGALQRTLDSGGTRSLFILVAFASDDRLVMGTSDDYSRVKAWDVESGARQWIIEDPHALLVAFSGDGRLLASSAESGGKTMIHIWDAATGALQRTLTGPVGTVACSGDGRLLASTCESDGKTIHVWDATTGALQRTLEGHDDYIMSVASSDDGRLLASSSVSGDKTIKVWDAATGALLRTLKVKDYLGNPLRPARFSSDGSHLLTEQGRARRDTSKHLVTRLNLILVPRLVRRWNITVAG